MKPYLVWSPPWDRSSAGIVALHVLAHNLALRGIPVSMNTDKQNPAWERLPLALSPDPEGTIAIYPEIVHGNPYEATTVVRLIMHRPGFWGGPTSYLSTDLLYVYSDFWNRESGLNLPQDRILFIPTPDLNRFYDMHLPRFGRLIYRGKGKQPAVIAGDSLGDKESFVGPGGQDLLRERLNQCELLYCYDNVTVMVDIARLCGCPVCLIPDPQFKFVSLCYPFPNIGITFYPETVRAIQTIDSRIIRQQHLRFEAEFQQRLGDFIRTTQEAI
jgi:hypothetical protein